MNIIINSQQGSKKKKPPMQTNLHKGLFRNDNSSIYLIVYPCQCLDCV